MLNQYELGFIQTGDLRMWNKSNQIKDETLARKPLFPIWEEESKGEKLIRTCSILDLKNPYSSLNTDFRKPTIKYLPACYLFPLQLKFTFSGVFTIYMPVPSPQSSISPKSIYDIIMNWLFSLFK